MKGGILPTITEYYGIQTAVEFLDVELSTDNRLYVDPRAVRLQRGQFATDANKCTQTFFDEITRCATSSRATDRALGLDLLQQFGEPKETRLGMSKAGIDGYGGSDEIGQAIWEALTTDLRALVVVGLLQLIEDIPIFVENVAEDRTSDLTTRIIFEPLARFTRAMVAKHPEFVSHGHTTESLDRQVWDPVARRWADKSLVLPIAQDKPLLLIPRDWVRANLLMSSTRFFETIMLSFAQEQRTVFDPRTGKELAPPKDDLKKQPAYARGVDTIVRVTEEANELGEDLVARFRHFVDQRYQLLTDDVIAGRIGG